MYELKIRISREFKNEKTFLHIRLQCFISDETTATTTTNNKTL